MVRLCAHVAAGDRRVDGARDVENSLLGRALGFGLDILIRTVEIGSSGCIGSELLVFQSPGGFRSLDLAHIVDTGARLAGLTGLHKIWNRDSGQHADDRNNNHDFNQGEPRLP